MSAHANPMWDTGTHSRPSRRCSAAGRSAWTARKVWDSTTLEGRLRGALRNREFAVCYQPIVDIETERVVALESLLRWQRPDGQRIAPDSFIGLAEQTGLIVPIGEWVLEQVLADAARWRDAGCSLVPIALNICAQQLERSRLHEQIVAGAQARGLDPSTLQIELTERALFEGREGANGQLDMDLFTPFRERGVHISIDDFGTGYSSLSYLRRWRVDSLKIDRCFVRDLATSADDRTIVAAICTMARCLNIAVIAEGVEDARQLAILREMGCGFAQGYLFSRPVDADRCVGYLAR